MNCGIFPVELGSGERGRRRSAVMLRGDFGGGKGMSSRPVGHDGGRGAKSSCPGDPFDMDVDGVRIGA